MVLPDDMPVPPTPKDQDITQGQKTNSTTRPAPEQGVKCPRCDSPNTKFCYYNNYSLTQPRHFCKTCRRYWTNGGALRNVPIGGGCRKNKKVKSSSSSSSSSRLSCDPKDFQFHGLTVPPSVEFQLGGLPFAPRLPPPPTGMFNNFSSFGDASASVTSALSGFQLDPPAASNSLMGLVPPNPELWGLGRSQSSTRPDLLTSAVQPLNVHSSLASSIESLSNINQDLHLKLQQQRLAFMFGGDSQKDDSGPSLSQQVLFQNLDISKPETLPAGSNANGGPTGETALSTEWFFGNSYSSVTPATSNGININDANNNWSTGALSWGDLQQQPYSALP